MLQWILEISLLQVHVGQSSKGNTTAAVVSLVPRFNELNHENEGKFSNVHINSISLCASTRIIDSGATDHIACSIDSFDKFHTVYGA